MADPVINLVLHQHGTLPLFQERENELTKNHEVLLIFKRIRYIAFFFTNPLVKKSISLFNPILQNKITTYGLKYELDDLLACNDCPDIASQPEGTDPIIYSSIEGCEAVCPDDSIQVTTVASPDGIGEYFTMYCTRNE